MGKPVDEEALHKVYYGPLLQAEPALVGTLLGVFGYQAQHIGFEMGPVAGKRRYLFFLATEGRLNRFKAELAAFDADPL
ncbi:hypothetical protein [Hymenobacter profundi]|uniref:Uncharacterized protein n=1 Tax=Hymenobacter profundi TaxID=1982110 RepID=A0ABS6WU86_9BACT|nr:hypothetical protein [Hymenobacter profundi]MBW3127145.1 hypothetical protein [Hymenobacter profundi]